MPGSFSGNHCYLTGPDLGMLYNTSKVADTTTCAQRYTSEMVGLNRWRLTGTERCTIQPELLIRAVARDRTKPTQDLSGGGSNAGVARTSLFCLCALVHLYIPPLVIAVDSGRPWGDLETGS